MDYLLTLLFAAANNAAAVVMNFDSVVAAPCTDGTAYMASFGVTVTGQASARICTGAPVGGAQPFSGANLLLLDNPPPSNCTYIYFFVFDNLVNDVSFVRTQINPQSAGPAWTATALSDLNAVLGSVGEGTTFAPSAQLFSLPFAGIKSIRFDTNNTSARTYNTTPIDDLSFTATPEPSTWLLVAPIVALLAARRRRH